MGSILYTKGLTKCPRDYRIESNVKKQRMRNSVFSVIKYFSNSKSVNWYVCLYFRNWRLRYWINKSSWIQVKGDVCFRQSCKWEFQCNFFSYLWAMEFYRIKCLVNHGKELTNTCVLSSKKRKIWIFSNFKTKDEKILRNCSTFLAKCLLTQTSNILAKNKKQELFFLNILNFHGW